MQKSNFYRSGRGSRDVERSQFHLLLDKKDRTKLIALSKRWKLNGSDVVRKLIAEA